MKNLSDLKARIKRAHYQGYKIAYAESYAAELGGGSPPEGVGKFSAEHLLHLIEMAEKGTPVKADPVKAEIKAEVEIKADASASEPSDEDKSEPEKKKKKKKSED